MTGAGRASGRGVAEFSDHWNFSRCETVLCVQTISVKTVITAEV
jgi:hypothetical protein